MTCLLLQCVAPMQSWGSRSRFRERDTEREPTKSGIIGLVCAALGRDRAERIDDLAALEMAVRVDAEGVLETDFHTAQDIDPRGRYGTETHLSYRAYLADAAFLVGLQGDAGLLDRIQSALANPVWPLFLGRKSFLPGLPVHLADGLRDEPLKTLLAEVYPSVAPPRRKSSDRPDRIRLVMECKPSEGEPRRDVPVSFAHGSRQFMTRFVKTEWIEPPVGKEVTSA